MAERWTVLKFGGTSVARASQWATISRLAQARVDEGGRAVLVCSALAGVTNRLQEIADGRLAPGAGFSGILDQHVKLADDLGVEAADLLARGRERLDAAWSAYHADPEPPGLAELLSQGEWLSSRLGAIYLGQELEVDWVDAREALRVLPEADGDSPRAWLSARCDAAADPRLARRWAAMAPILVTQGFVASAADGRTALLGRGGSDTSAALLGARLAAGMIEIWTDVAGLYSADPRDEPRARLLQALDFTEALELAASGARVVHPRCIRAAADAGIPLRVRDLRQPDGGGTLISGHEPSGGDGIKAVVRQDDMLVLLLENRDIRQQVGFLAWVFEVISRQGISIDLVATSETTTTLAINAAANHLEPGGIGTLVGELERRCRVEVFERCSCVNLVGRGARNALARLAPAVDMFRRHPLLMVSQSANDMCLSLLVQSEQAARLAACLHEALVLDEPPRPATET